MLTLGVLLNAIAMDIHLPGWKLCQLMEKHELLFLIKKLSHMANIVIPGRTSSAAWSTLLTKPSIWTIGFTSQLLTLDYCSGISTMQVVAPIQTPSITVTTNEAEAMVYLGSKLTSGCSALHKGHDTRCQSTRNNYCLPFWQLAHRGSHWLNSQVRFRQ